MQLLDKNQLNLAKVDNNFFPYFHVENALSNFLNSSDLVKDFPDIDSGGSFPSDNLKEGDIKKLVEELEGDEFKAILENKLGVNLKDAEVITTLRGFSRFKDGKIHTDSQSKIVTVLLYLNKNWDNEIGNLRLLKKNNDLDNYIQEISSEYGNLVAFKVTDNCWHGFMPFEGKRLSIQLNYIYPKSLNMHKIRHKLSASFKKLISGSSN
jgi:Rps23 Pro-64 3,4-dihydroxylase Tpa1-like proline 4-hydroxylase